MHLQLSNPLADRLIAIAAGIALLCAATLWWAALYPASMRVDAAAAGVLALLWCARRRLAVGPKLATLAVTGLVVAGTAILQNPYAPDGYLVVAAVMVISFTNWNGWRALALPVASALLLGLFAAGLSLGWHPFAGQAGSAQQRPEAWLVVCLTVCLLGFSMGGAIFELKRRLLRQIGRLEAGNRQLSHYALRDRATGLWNQEYLCREIARLAGGGPAHELLVIELHGLQQLHALHGPQHAARVWHDLASLLRDSHGDSFTLCRLAGDQIALWAPGPWRTPPVEVYEDFKWRAEARLALARLGLKLKAARLAYPAHGHDLDTLCRSVHAALRQARVDGRCLAFNEAMARELAAEQQLKVRIRDALDEQRFHAVYQAKVSSDEHRLVGFEGLARMQAQGDESVPGPGVFVAVMHAEGWMTEFGELMLRRILADIPQLCQRFGAGIQVAANVSPPLFLSAGFPTLLRRLLQQAGVAPTNLIVEITEEVFAGDVQALKQACAELRELGVQVSLDDFGSGFSSLGYLREVQFDEIKIDRSFVQRIESDERSRLVLSTLCELGRDFECRVVIEGVETAGQVERISRLRGDCVQGFFFARPERLETLLATADADRK